MLSCSYLVSIGHLHPGHNSIQCVEKPDPCDYYDITSPIHNTYSLFLLERETLLTSQLTVVKVVKLA